MFSQVVYFTATFPYVLLVAITAYGLTLPGALDGVKELFVPKAWTGPKTITDPQVWRKAAEQMFYSLSVSFVVNKTEYNFFSYIEKQKYPIIHEDIAMDEAVYT